MRVSVCFLHLVQTVDFEQSHKESETIPMILLKYFIDNCRDMALGSTQILKGIRVKVTGT